MRLNEAGREDLIGNGPKCLNSIKESRYGRSFNHGKSSGHGKR